MKRRIDTYGDIVHPDFRAGTLASLKETAAKLISEEIALYRQEKYTDPTEYVSQWYYWDDNQRTWRPK